MKVITMISMLLLFAVAACTQNPVASSSDDRGDTFGAGVSADDYVSYDDLMSQLNAKDTVRTTMMATVSEVCQAKGCWMTLVPGKANANSEIMVKFKDYGFFVPKDISGKSVLVEGQAYKTVVPVDELRHYAEDAGKSKEEIEKITEPQESFAFLASGVIVLKGE